MRRGRVVVFATGMLLIASGTGHAKGGNQGLFTNEQRTAACQQYINALYPPTTGQMDRQRESAYAANTGAERERALFLIHPSAGSHRPRRASSAATSCGENTTRLGTAVQARARPARRTTGRRLERSSE